MRKFSGAVAALARAHDRTVAVAITTPNKLSKLLEAAMPRFFIRIAQMLVLALIGAAFFATSLFAEKMSVANMNQMCTTSGGTLFVERTGKYSCVYPTTDYGGGVRTTGYINCQANGECEAITYCGRRICGRAPFTDRSKQTKSGENPKPTKLDGPAVMTAGTADQRGAGVSGGSTAGALNPNLGASSTPTNSVLTGSTGAALGTPAAPTKSATGISKPSTIPTQLAERLRRLQQQR